MKITKIDTFTVKGLAWPWLFCAVRTDEGITGYSEFGFGRLAHGIVGLVKDFEDVLVGKDPRPVEQNYEAMRRMSEYSFSGARPSRPSRASSLPCGTSKAKPLACRSTNCWAAQPVQSSGFTGPILPHIRSPSPRFWELLLSKVGTTFALW
ncbi:MAG: hypothetical protein QF368_10495 [SAR202 cluster bacterium]|nr:hypothetical protein [SAR202 cluster bacterium]